MRMPDAAVYVRGAVQGIEDDAVAAAVRLVDEDGVIVLFRHLFMASIGRLHNLMSRITRLLPAAGFPWLPKKSRSSYWVLAQSQS